MCVLLKCTIRKRKKHVYSVCTLHTDSTRSLNGIPTIVIGPHKPIMSFSEYIWLETELTGELFWPEHEWIIHIWRVHGGGVKWPSDIWLCCEHSDHTHGGDSGWLVNGASQKKSGQFPSSTFEYIIWMCSVEWCWKQRNTVSNAYTVVRAHAITLTIGLIWVSRTAVTRDTGRVAFCQYYYTASLFNLKTDFISILLFFV